LEASALTHASQRGLLARRSPLLKLQGDGRLIAMVRSGNAGAFETIVDRYQGRLLGFCRQMLGSTEDAEDVLQEVFVNAYRAMLADEREINLRPWLYRIARNRCLNHLRKPTADAQESMDMVPMVEAGSTAEKVHNREEFRQLLSDVSKLPETQRSALLLREMDAMSYEEIAQAMDTSVPSVKSLLVRARISLAEASQARQLTCGEVRLELAEAAEGLRKVSGPIRRHVRDCDECSDFRSQVRSNDKVLAALFPATGLLALKGFIAGKLGFGGATGSAAGAGAASGGAATGAVGGVGAALSGGGAAGGIGAVGGAIGSKAVAGVVTAAVLTAGAVEVQQQVDTNSGTAPTPLARTGGHTVAHAPTVAPSQPAPEPPVAAISTLAPPAEPEPAPVEVEGVPPQSAALTADSAAGSTAPSVKETGEANTTKPKAPSLTGATAKDDGAPVSSGGTVVVTVGGTTPPPPATEGAPPAEEPAPSPPPPSESPAGETSAEEPPTEASTPLSSGTPES
jgi:RNA polymerase sigma factor (sigma-70 family)